MSKLGDLAYQKPDLCLKYKGKVVIPPLGMIDDILCLQRCSKSQNINASINTFIELKKLRFSHKKCSQIHVGKGQQNCAGLKVHANRMNRSIKEKYLGDLVTDVGNNKANISDRVAKGYAIVNEIKAILSDIPLGIYKLNIGMKLRSAMLHSAILFNSEAWHGITLADIKRLEQVDEHLLRFLLGSHRKCAIEMLYLESGSWPLRFDVIQRRIMYLHTILKRSDDELTKQVLHAQMADPCRGDFVNLVKDDIKAVNLDLNFDDIKSLSKQVLKKQLKSKIKKTAFKHLNKLKSQHSKVRHMSYTELVLQPYLKSKNITNEQAKLLFGLRTKTVKGIKANFAQMNLKCLHCPLKCWENDEAPEIDTQEHLLKCKKLADTEKTGRVEYSQNYSDLMKQKEAIVVFKYYLEKREDLLSNPANTLDPSTVFSQCCDHAAIICPN